MRAAAAFGAACTSGMYSGQSAIRQRRCVGLPVLPVIEGGRGAPYQRPLSRGGVQGNIPLHILPLTLSLARSSHASHLPTYYLYLLLCVQISIFYNEARDLIIALVRGRGRWGWNYRARQPQPARREPPQSQYECLRAQCIMYYADATLSVFNGRREIVLLKPNNCTTHKLIREVGGVR